MRRSTGAAIVTILLVGRLAFAQNAALKPVPPDAIAPISAKLDRKLLPTHSSHVKVARKQVFMLVAGGKQELLLMPVKFYHGEQSPVDAEPVLVDRDRCGVFVVYPDGAQSFVWTMDDEQDLAVGLCHGISALGTMPNEERGRD